LEQVADAARAAEQARAAADRSRDELSATAAACEEAATRSARVATLRALVPEQNSGSHSWASSVPRPLHASAPRSGPRDADVGSAADVADEVDTVLLDTVTTARTAWDAAPFLPPLDGPSADQLRHELACLPEGGVEAQVRSLADAHR